MAILLGFVAYFLNLDLLTVAQGDSAYTVHFVLGGLQYIGLLRPGNPACFFLPPSELPASACFNTTSTQHGAKTEEEDTCWLPPSFPPVLFAQCCQMASSIGTKLARCRQKHLLWWKCAMKSEVTSFLAKIYLLSPSFRKCGSAASARGAGGSAFLSSPPFSTCVCIVRTG